MFKNTNFKPNAILATLPEWAILRKTPIYRLTFSFMEIVSHALVQFIQIVDYASIILAQLFAKLCRCCCWNISVYCLLIKV